MWSQCLFTVVETLRVINLETIPLQHDPKLENRRSKGAATETGTTLHFGRKLIWSSKFLGTREVSAVQTWYFSRGPHFILQPLQGRLLSFVTRFRRSSVLFWLLRASGMNVLYIDTCSQSTHMHQKKIRRLDFRVLSTNKISLCFNIYNLSYKIKMFPLTILKYSLKI